MNYDRIYAYRFKGVNAARKQMVWNEIAHFVYGKLGKPNKVLDPAAGLCEFINAVPASERWALDMNENLPTYAQQGVKTLIGNNLETELPRDYFDGVFVSNFLEHLFTQLEVADFLEKMHASIRSGGRIAVIGPNFKYTYRQYFDFADHTVLLSELGLAEHLYGAGFEIEQVYPRFLPLSFRGGLPVNKFLVQTYLKMPWAWRFFGKQFLVIARKP